MAVSVSRPPVKRPLLVYDGDCAFCLWWLVRIREAVGDRAVYAPFQETAGDFPELPASRFRRSVQLIEPSGAVYEGAEAIFRALALVPGRRHWLWLYRRVPGARPAFETGYRFVAGHRPALYRLTRLAFGEEPRRAGRTAARRLLLPLLGLAAGLLLLARRRRRERW